MIAHQILSWVSAVLLTSAVFAAPIQELLSKDKKDVPLAVEPKVDEQEAELEQLVSLAGKASHNNNVAVHESHISHYENKNGQTVKVEQTEQKVTDTKTGEVLSDVKQEVTDGTGVDKVTKTEVIIPEKGVDETFVKDEVEETESKETFQSEDENVGFTPQAVAEYLMKTKDFDNFEGALKDLVQSRTMTQVEAEQYEEQVILEYQALQSEQDALSRIFVDDESMPEYFNGYQDFPEKRSNMAPQDSLFDAQPSYDNVFDNGYDFGQERSNTDSISEIIDELLNAWWEKDFEGGNVRAQALVSYLYDVVSRDNNPQDIEQIRRILAEMLATSLLEDIDNSESDYKEKEEVQLEEDTKESAQYDEEEEQLSNLSKSETSVDAKMDEVKEIMKEPVASSSEHESDVEDSSAEN